jgi:muramidase (phage lysozyme)
MADGLSPSQYSVLDAIAHAEVRQPWNGNTRSGYGETVSNQRFDPSDYSAAHPYESGKFRYYQGKYGPSSASGRYQETLSTYRDNVKKYGIAGFSPDAQDRRAFAKASDLYQTSGAWKNYQGATGDLSKDVEKFGGDRNWWSSAAAPALKNEWTSVPGGLEPNPSTRGWVNNAVARYNNQGTGALPSEQAAGATYSLEDAPALLSQIPQNTGPSSQVTGVAYEAPPAQSTGALASAQRSPQIASAAGASGLGGLLGRLLGTNSPAGVLGALAQGSSQGSFAPNLTPPAFLPMQPLQPMPAIPQLSLLQQPQPYFPNRRGT